MWKRFKNTDKEKLHTLCQLKLSIDANRNRDKVSLQIYTFMDFFPEKIKKILGPLFPILKPFLMFILDRLIVVQGHLSDKDSHGFSISMSEDGQLSYKKTMNKKVDKVIREVTLTLMKNTFYLGFFPIFLMTKINKIGRGVHFGSSFPMTTSKDKEFYSDLYGCPLDYKNVHIVDASIIPSIEAGPITSTVMANAYRIGSEISI